MLILGMVLVLTGCSAGTSAKEYYKKGITELEKGNYEMAEEALEKAVEKNGKKAEYYIGYGMALIKMKKYEEAQKQFDYAILDKNNQIVRENNKEAYRGKGIAYLESGEYEDAIENFQKALKIDEKNDLNQDIMYYLAEADEKNEDYEGAIIVYNNIESIEKSGTLYLKRAQANMELEQYDAAGNDFDRAINMEKNNLSYFLEKYFMLIQADKTEEAKELLDTASAVEAKDDTNKVYLAMIHYYQGGTEKAIAELSELKQSNNILACYYLGDIYIEEKEYEKAAVSYEAYLDSEETDEELLTDVYESLANCYVKLSKYEKAIILLEKAVALEEGKDQKKLKKILISIYEKNLQFDKALQVAENYLEIYPKDKEIKREYQFLRSRVETVGNEYTTKTTMEPAATETVVTETMEPLESMEPESTESATPSQTSGTTAVPTATANTVEKPDIVE